MPADAAPPRVFGPGLEVTDAHWRGWACCPLVWSVSRTSGGVRPAMRRRSRSVGGGSRQARHQALIGERRSREHAAMAFVGVSRGCLAPACRLGYFVRRTRNHCAVSRAGGTPRAGRLGGPMRPTVALRQLRARRGRCLSSSIDPAGSVGSRGPRERFTPDNAGRLRPSHAAIRQPPYQLVTKQALDA